MKMGNFALKGQKNLFLLELLPLQGEHTNGFVHRALPYAMCFWAFSPSVTQLRTIISSNNERNMNFFFNVGGKQGD